MITFDVPFIFIITGSLLFSFVPIDGANILVLHPVYAGSHEHVLRTLGDYLVENHGHNVTQIRFQYSKMKDFPDSKVNILSLNLEDPDRTCPGYINEKGEFDIEIKGAREVWKHGHTFYGLPSDLLCTTNVHCTTLFNSEEVRNLLNETRFDLVMIDLISNECGLALAWSLQVPVAGFWGFSLHGGEVMYTSVFNPPSIVPGFFSGYTSRMNFFQRVVNFVLNLGHRIYMQEQTRLAEDYIQAKFSSVPAVSKMVHSLEMLFVNSNFFVDCPRLSSPEVKYVGGLHFRNETLPKEYQEFIESSRDGVILFCLGCTGFSSKDFPVEVTRAFLRAFSRLKQKVIMRFEPKLIPFQPENVMVSSWVPQQAILAHPNVIGFVTHCGMGSLLEAVYHSVPMVALGIFGDQPDNAARVVENGFGVQLFKHELTEETILGKITEIVTDPSYFDNVKRISEIWKEQPLKPLQETAFWIEQLLKHKSLKHLKIRDHDLSLLQYFSLDVILFLMSLACLSFFVTFKLTKKIYRCIRIMLANDSSTQKLKKN